MFGHPRRVLDPWLSTMKADSDTNKLLFRQVSAMGYSEVIVENCVHNGLIAIVSADQVALGLRAMQARGKILVQQPNVRLQTSARGSVRGLPQQSHRLIVVMGAPVSTTRPLLKTEDVVDAGPRVASDVTRRCRHALGSSLVAPTAHRELSRCFLPRGRAGKFPDTKRQL